MGVSVWGIQRKVSLTRGTLGKGLKGLKEYVT